MPIAYHVTAKSRLIPYHQMGEGHWKNGRCQKFIRLNNKGEAEKCGQVLSHPCHRVYPCRITGCGQAPLLSIESRDRHEANAHGNGW